MAAAFVGWDRETFLKLCDVLGLDPQGILELTIHCGVKTVTTYDVKYLHQSRIDRELVPKAESATDPSWRTDPQL